MNQLQEEHEEARGSEPPKNMGELYRLLSVLGHTWREENKYIVNEGKKNQETKIPLPAVSYIANVFREHCYIGFNESEIKSIEII